MTDPCEKARGWLTVLDASTGKSRWRYASNTPMLAAVPATAGPAVLLCSNYVWSLAHNLEVARRAKAVCPELVVVHGGPSTPKYEGDAERFLAEHGDVADVLVRGEGELTLCRLLEALAPGWPGVDLGCLSAIEGLTFRVDGRVVRTGEPVRVADLDSFPWQSLGQIQRW